MNRNNLIFLYIEAIKLLHEYTETFRYLSECRDFILTEEGSKACTEYFKRPVFDPNKHSEYCPQLSEILVLLLKTLDQIVLKIRRR